MTHHKIPFLAVDCYLHFWDYRIEFSILFPRTIEPLEQAVCEYLITSGYSTSGHGIVLYKELLY